MYNAKSVSEWIKLIGVDEFIKFVSSDDFPDESKNGLAKLHVFVNGYPCVSEICRLAAL